MAFSDWDTFTSGTFTIVHDTGTKVVGIGSIGFESSTGNGVVGSAVVSDSSGLTKGALDGKIRAVMHYIGATGSGTATNFAGLSCMHSAADITSVGSCYSLIWFFRDDDVVEDLRLVKHTNGIDSTSFTTLDSTSFTKSSGDTWTFELEWISSLSATIGGTLLRGRIGTATDFSDLADTFEYVDTDSALTTSAAEGMFHRYQSSTTSFARDLYFDQTTLFTLA